MAEEAHQHIRHGAVCNRHCRDCGVSQLLAQAAVTRGSAKQSLHGGLHCLRSLHRRNRISRRLQGSRRFYIGSPALIHETSGWQIPSFGEAEDDGCKLLPHVALGCRARGSVRAPHVWQRWRWISLEIMTGVELEERHVKA